MQRNSCNYCQGKCPTPEACEIPIEVRPLGDRRIFTRRRWHPVTDEGWGRLIGALLGLGGVVLFGRSLVRYLFGM